MKRILIVLFASFFLLNVGLIVYLTYGRRFSQPSSKIPQAHPQAVRQFEKNSHVISIISHIPGFAHYVRLVSMLDDTI